MSVEKKIRERLKAAYPDCTLEIVNQSHLHKGHMGDDGSGESHFKLMVVSSAFHGMSRVERQKSLFLALGDDLISQIHALSMKISSV